MDEIRAARPGITEGELRQEVFLLCYGDELSPEQRERILTAVAAYWARREAGQQADAPIETAGAGVARAGSKPDD